MFTENPRRVSRRLLGFLLVLCILLSGCTPYIPVQEDPAPESSLEELSSQNSSQNPASGEASSLEDSHPSDFLESSSISRAHIPFHDMVYERPDMETIYADCDTLLETLSLGLRSAQQVFSLYDTILAHFDHVYTMYTLASIHSDLDLTDTYYLEEISFLSDALNALSYRITEITDILLQSSYEAAFRKHMGTDFVHHYLTSYSLPYEETESLFSQETALLQQYSQYLVTDYTTTLHGQEVSLQDLTLETPEEWEAYDAIYAQKNADCATVYQRLAEVRTQIAQASGYENYIDFAYQSLERDYTKEDAAQFTTLVKKFFIPLVQEFEERYYDILYNHMPQYYISDKMALYYLRYAIEEEFSPQMAEAFTYMQENQLYSFSYASNTLPSAYTAYLSEMRSPFILINTMYYSPATTLFHEFGHYYNYYLYDGSGWNDSENLDLAEVHSQGLELLMLPHYPQIYKEDAQNMEILLIHSILLAVLTGCCEDEFQQRVFENPEMRIEEMNQLHEDLYMEYFGYSSYYEWVDITQHFESPFYYISYATSAVSALELWAFAEGDREAALDAYQTLCEFTVNSGYLEPLAEAGLSSPFDESALSDLARTITSHYLQTTEPAPNNSSN